jgi:hypothetical protein
MIESTHIQTIINQTWNRAAGKFDYSFVFAFQNKEQYLAFRRYWKEKYTALSGAIRIHKREIKTTQRKFEYAGKLQSKVHELKRDATIQLCMLRAAKQEANRQYLQAKQATQ